MLKTLTLLVAPFLMKKLKHIVTVNTYVSVTSCEEARCDRKEGS